MLENILLSDEKLFLFLNNLGTSNWDWLWHFITDKWSSVPLYLFLLFLLYKKVNGKAVLITLGMIILLIFCSDQFSNILKNGFQRPRPCRLEIPGRFIANCGRNGFPSAHAFSSMALAVFMGKILKPYYKFALPGLLFWSLLLGISRIYVGVHYPGDVLVGFLLGICLGLIFFKFKIFLLRKWKISSENVFKIYNLFNWKKNSIYKIQKSLLFLSLFIITILYIRTEKNPSLFILEDTSVEKYYEMFAVFISLLGCGLRIFTLGFHRKHPLSFYENKNENQQIKGIYSAVKYPLYLANFFIFFGIVLWTGNYWFILFFFSAYWILSMEAIRIKEHIFQQKYGNVFSEWKEKTPNFIPDFSEFKKTSSAFNWKRILNEEIKFIFFLFLIFSSFNLIAKYVGNPDLTQLNYYLFFFNFFFGLILLIVQFLKEKTDLFVIDTKR